MSKETQTVVPLVSVRVLRDGKIVRPEIGKPFEFTNEEVGDLSRAAEASGTPYFRDLIKEEVGAPATAATKKAEAKKAAAAGASKAGDGDL